MMRAAAAILTLVVSSPALAQQVYEVYDPRITRPAVIKSVHARYPAEAMRRKISGSVLLGGVVLDTGRVVDIRVIDSLDLELDLEAIAAFTQWEFRPGTKDAEPVGVRVTCTMIFTLKS